MDLQNEHKQQKLPCHVNAAMSIECNDEICILGPTECCNRFLTGKAPYELKVVETGKTGRGVMLGRTRISRKGIYIGEYTGVVKIHDNRELDTEHPNYKAQLGDKLMIDAVDSKNVLKYLNHSCNPNSGLETWYTGQGEPRLCLLSIKKVPNETELTIDYSGMKGLEYAKGFFSDGICLCNTCSI
jgi:hypothetical protein